MLQPQAFGAFSTPTMTTDFVILDEHGNAYVRSYLVIYFFEQSDYTVQKYI